MSQGRRGFCRALAGLGCLGLGGCKIEKLVDLVEQDEVRPPSFPQLPPQIPDQLANADATLRKVSEAMLERELPLLRSGGMRERDPGAPQVVAHFVELMREFGLQPAGNRGGWRLSVALEVVEPSGAAPRVVLRPESERSFLAEAPAPASDPAEPGEPGESTSSEQPDGEASTPPDPSPEGPGPDGPEPGNPGPDGPPAQPESSQPEPPPSRALDLAPFGAFRQRGQALAHEALPLSPVIPFETPLPSEVIVGRVAVLRAPKDLELAAADAAARVDLIVAAVRDAGGIGCLLLTDSDELAIVAFREAWRRQVRRAGSTSENLLIEGLLGKDASEPLDAALGSEGTWVLDLDLGTRERTVESHNVIGRIIGSERPDEAVVLTCNWDTSSPELAELETQRLLATLTAFQQLAEWSRRSSAPRYSLILLLTVDAGLAAGHAVHASWSADYGAETKAVVALDRPSVEPLPAVELSGRYDAGIAELCRRVVAANNRDLLLVDQLQIPSLAPYLRHSAPIVCVGAPAPEALEDRARDGGEAGGGDEDGSSASDDPNAGLFADVRLLRNLMLALAASR